ncbi:MAG: hypothetical protein M8467_20255 [Anaerolineae bacterium]|nr:hypothetical protein [Anaerolineae bacterium]
MRQTLKILVTAVAVLTIAGCVPGRSSPTAIPASPTTQPIEGTPTQAAAVQPSPTPSPVVTPKPSPTLVPTVTRRPPPTPTSEQVATLSPEVVTAMETIELEMEALRGLDENEPISRTLVSRQELGAYLDQQFLEDYTADEIEADVRVLAAFDFVEVGYDLRQVLLDVYSAEVLGLYEDDEDTLYVVTEGGFSLLNQLTFAHEYVHGLQDQHFDLDTFVDDDRLSDDQVLARMALVEGDASQAMSQYLMLHISDLTNQDLQELTEEADSSDGAALASAPAIIRETVLFPYTYGLEFVLALYEGGWRAVDAAFAQPPQSTEQILHPQKYLDGDEPQIIALPPLTDTLGSGWTLLESEVLGEFQTSLYLSQQVAQETVELASEGWDGDRYVVYTRDGTDVLVFATVWDTEADREEFVDAYRQYAEAKYRGVGHGTGEAEMRWEAPGEVTLLTWKGDRAFIVVAPDAATVDRVLGALDL